MSSAAPDPLGGTPSAEFIPPACTWGAGTGGQAARGRWAAKAREARLARRRFGNKIEMVLAWRNGCWIEASSSKRYARTGFLLEVLHRPQCSFMAMSRCNAIARTQASRHHQFAMSTVTYSFALTAPRLSWACYHAAQHPHLACSAWLRARASA